MNQLKTILLYELKRTYRSWLYFTLSMLATFAIFASFFEFFREDAAIIDRLLQNFPAEFKAAFGFADVNLATVDGFLSFIVGYLVLVGAVFAMKLGVGLLSAEPREKTADFLLSRPVLRSQIVGAKLAVALIETFSQIMLIFGFGWAALPALAGGSATPKSYILLILSIFLVQLFFLGIGSRLAASASRIKSVMPVTMGIVFFFFIIELVNESLLLKELTYLTPFHYFKGSAILGSGQYDWSYLALDLIVFFLTTSLSFVVYRRRDFHAV